jgi:transcriptional regulator with XRE-family HTH domain
VNNAENRPNGAERLSDDAEDSKEAAENLAEAAELPGDSAEIGARHDFAAELRSWRALLGLSQVALGDRIGYSGSLVSDVERCARMPTADFAVACDRGLNLPGTFVRLLKRISLESFPGWFAPVIPFESQASKIQIWDMRCLPGLLQTTDYARAVIRAGHPDHAEDIVRRDVAARLQRQEIFSREYPPAAWFIIDESALRRVFGSRTIMAEQLGRLLEKSMQQGIMVQIMPIEAADCCGVDGPMTVFDFPGSPQVGYTEGCKVGRIIEAPAEVATLVTKFDHLRAVALPPLESSRLLAEIRSEYSE